jgi:AMMECR1 domain-containing protein
MEPHEVEKATVEVSVLSPEEPVSGLAELDPKRYGVIVRDARGRRGVLLPDIPGVEDPTTQVDIARRKAGIEPGEPVEIRRFRVRKWVDPR